MQDALSSQKPTFFYDEIIRGGFIDDIAHSLGRSVHGNGQCFLTALENHIHQLIGERFHAQGRERKFFSLFDNFSCQCWKIRMIRHRWPNQTHCLHRFPLPVEHDIHGLIGFFQVG